MSLDSRSFQLNFEATALVMAQDFAGELEAMFLAAFGRFREMTRAAVDAQPLWYRVLSRAACLLAPVLWWAPVRTGEPRGRWYMT